MDKGAASNISVLVIEDDEAFATELADALTQYDIPTGIALDWEAGMRAVERLRPRLILLDQRLGRVDSVARLHELRALTNAPVVMLSGQLNEADRIVALELGADDYLSKPVSTREMLARVRAHLRRSSALGQRSELHRWRIAPRERRLYRPDGTAVALTGAEFDMLVCLTQSPGDPVTREALSQQVLNRDYRAEDRALDNLIYQIRMKIRDAGGGDVILSSRNRGYYFTGFPEWAG